MTPEMHLWINVCRVPPVRQFLNGPFFDTFDELFSFLWGFSSGVDDGFLERMMADDQEFISVVKLVDVFIGGQVSELASFTPVAMVTGQHQIPSLIEVQMDAPVHEGVWKKMVHIGVHVGAI